jgi:hypothetical protein
MKEEVISKMNSISSDVLPDFHTLAG